MRFSRFRMTYIVCVFALLCAALPLRLLAAPSTGTITGLVVDNSNQALSGATVSAGGKTTTTDSAGHYTLTAVRSGKQTVTASKLFYVSRSATVTGRNGFSRAGCTVDLISAGCRILGRRLSYRRAWLLGSTCFLSHGALHHVISLNWRESKSGKLRARQS